MKITLNCSTVLAAIKDIEQNTKSLHCSARIREIRGMPCLSFVAQGNGVIIERILHDIEVENSEGEFTFNIPVLKGILNRRKKINVSYVEQESTLKFSDTNGTYKGDTVILPYEAIDFEKSETPTLRLTKDIHDMLMSALASIRINDLYGSAGVMSALVSIKRDGMRVATYDQFHMACARLDKALEIPKDIQFVLPLSVFDCINNLANGADYLLSISEASIFATDRSTFRISMPLIQASLPMSMQQVINLIKAIPKSPSIKFTLNKEDLSTALSNTAALAEPNSSVTLACIKKNQLNLSIKTNYGFIEDSLEVTDFAWLDKSLKLSVDPVILADLLGVVSESSVTVLASDKFICIPSVTEGMVIYYFSSLL